MTTTSKEGPPPFSADVPVPARLYDYCLGGKDNFAVDREAVLAVSQEIPEAVDSARANRRFLYRAVRFLARDAGIRQYIDMGSGLPTQNNVHEVAQRFQPDARVVYIDHDPIVVTYGRALLADSDRTTVITADLTRPTEILNDPTVQRLIDFSAPVAVLFLSVAHFVPEDTTVRAMLGTVVDAIVPGSYVAFSQIVGPSRAAVEHSNNIMKARGVTWRNRIKADVTGFLHGLEPVEPGLVNVEDWRPDPFQPELPPVDEALTPYVGASAVHKGFMEFGGVLRRLTDR
ncbi:MAG TPA: SAM-dependent methyltransferase [Streptosporangiaceae bacterium]|nr:SAM-dependent methyltransferase [Streptosporangiaceae bacterium]